MTHFLTTAAAAAQLGVSRRRVLQLIRDGRLPTTRFGHAHAIDPADLARLERQPTGWPAGRRRKAAGGLVRCREVQAHLDRLGWSSTTAPPGVDYLDALIPADPGLVVLLSLAEAVTCRAAGLVPVLAGLTPPLSYADLWEALRPARVMFPDRPGADAGTCP